MSSRTSPLLGDRAARPNASPEAGPETESSMPDPDDPDLMTPEARTREIASILATGYLRMQEPRAPETPPAGGLPADGDMSPGTENRLDRVANHTPLTCLRSRKGE